MKGASLGFRMDLTEGFLGVRPHFHKKFGVLYTATEALTEHVVFIFYIFYFSFVIL